MRKVLIAATVSEMIEAFLVPNIDKLLQMGNEVHVAADFEDEDVYRMERNDLFQEQLLQRGVKVHKIPMQRNPFHLENRESYQLLKELIDKEQYAIIHCHTPVGGVLTRLAARQSRNQGTKVVYTAHGFHFFKGAPLKNWLMYYPVEKFLARYTDSLITITQEDYETAHAKRFKAKAIEMISGVGINPDKFTPVTDSKRKYLRELYGYGEDEFLLIYVGELSYRKHQDMLISIMPKVIQSIPHAKLLLVGDGDKEKEKEFIDLIETLKLRDHVKLLGFRRDVHQLMSLSDIVVSASRQEGLPVNVMEAMSIGLPLIVTDCRGNRDLVQDGKNGFVVGIDENKIFIEKIKELHRSKDKREAFGRVSLNEIQFYSIEHVNNQLSLIYENLLNATEKEVPLLPQLKETK